MNEATEPQTTTKRREEAPRLAVRAEKRATKSYKIIVLFSETETAKQNQKFPFHFLSAPPTPPAENQKLRKGNFWFLLPRPKGADEARIIGFGNRFELGTINTHVRNAPLAQLVEQPVYTGKVVGSSPTGCTKL